LLGSAPCLDYLLLRLDGLTDCATEFLEGRLLGWIVVELV